MSAIASQPLEGLSSSEGAQAHGEPDTRSMAKTGITDEKIDALTWLVEKLSNSLSETRSRQTRLAEALEQSLTGISRALAESEAHVEEILDARLSRFEKAREKKTEGSDDALKALAALVEAETERNDKALGAFRSSLEAMERTLARSETRFEEKLEERLSPLEQERDAKSDASDETLGALAARLDVESEQNESALADLRAALVAMERTVADSEARFEERLNDGLDGLEQRRAKDSEAGDKKTNALGAKLDAATKRSEKELSTLRTMLEAMERTIASSEARVEESLGERIGSLERARDKDSHSGDETLEALAKRLDAESEKNGNLLSEFRASLETMEENFAELESQFVDAMKGGLSLYDQAKKKEAEALKGTVEDLMKQGCIREAIEMHWNKKKD